MYNVVVFLFFSYSCVLCIALHYCFTYACCNGVTYVCTVQYSAYMCVLFHLPGNTKYMVSLKMVFVKFKLLLGQRQPMKPSSASVAVRVQMTSLVRFSVALQ